MTPANPGAVPQASAVRSFIVGLRLASPRTFEMQTYASIAEVAKWIVGPHATRTGIEINRSELERVLVDFRSKLPA